MRSKLYMRGSHQGCISAQNGAEETYDPYPYEYGPGETAVFPGFRGVSGSVDRACKQGCSIWRLFRPALWSGRLAQLRVSSRGAYEMEQGVAPEVLADAA